jgi:hypothetical protein
MRRGPRQCYPSPGTSTRGYSRKDFEASTTPLIPAAPTYLKTSTPMVMNRARPATSAAIRAPISRSGLLFSRFAPEVFGSDLDVSSELVFFAVDLCSSSPENVSKISLRSPILVSPTSLIRITDVALATPGVEVLQEIARPCDPGAARSLSAIGLKLPATFIRQPTPLEHRRNICYHTSCRRSIQPMFNESNSNHSWIMIIYRVPTTPSTSRVTVWKKTKELGAYLLQQSVYVLPNIPEVNESVGRLKDLITHLGGESKFIEVASLGDEQEKEVIAGLNKNREEEYTEVVKACEELLHEIDEESKAQDFHFADLEENEKHLQRVREHLEAVRNRDYFGCPLRARALELIDECQNRFQSFSQEVFSMEVVMNDDKRLAADPGSGHREEFALSKSALSSRVQSIISDLERGTLDVDKNRVGNLAESIMLKLEFREHKNERLLLLAVSWSVPHGRKDRS